MLISVLSSHRKYQFPVTCRLYRHMSSSYTYTHLLNHTNQSKRESYIHKESKRIFTSPSITIHMVGTHIIKYANEMTANHIAQLLYSIGRYQLIVPSMYLELLTPAFENKSFTAFQLGKIFYGMRRMNAHDKVVQEMLHILVPVIENPQLYLNSDTLSRILFGMQSMSSNSGVVRQVLRALCVKFRASRYPFRPKEISMCLYGLRNMNSSHSEVRALLYVLAGLVDNCDDIMSPLEISNALYGIQGMTSEHEETLRVVKSLNFHISKCKNSFSARDIMTAMYGLHRLSSSELEVRTMLEHIRKKLLLCQESLSGTQVSFCLYSMQCMTIRHKEVRAMLSVLALKLAGDNCILESGRSIGNALYGMRSMSSGCPEVLRVLQLLTAEISTSESNLYSQDVGNCLYGLKSMQSTHFRVQQLLSALANKVDKFSGKLSARDACSSVYGLQGMTSEHASVRELVDVLSKKLQYSAAANSGQYVGNMLYGLRSMSSSHIEVRRILCAISNLVEGYRGPINAHELSSALFGMQGMSSEYDEVTRAMLLICQHMSSDNQGLNCRCIGMGLYGLQHMSLSHDATLDVLTALGKWVDQHRSNGGHMSANSLSLALFSISSLIFEFVSRSERGPLPYVVDSIANTLLSFIPPDVSTMNAPAGSLASLYRSIRLLSHFGNPCFSMDTTGKLHSLMEDFTTMSECANSDFDSKNRSRIETVFSSFAVNILSKVDEVKFVSPNKILHGFEADIIIGLSPSVRSEGVMYNIELDGPSHIYPSKKRFSCLRDRYLEEVHSVVVKRMYIDTYGHMSNSEIEECVLPYLRKHIFNNNNNG